MTLHTPEESVFVLEGEREDLGEIMADTQAAMHWAVTIAPYS